MLLIANTKSRYQITSSSLKTWVFLKLQQTFVQIQYSKWFRAFARLCEQTKMIKEAGSEARKRSNYVDRKFSERLITRWANENRKKVCAYPLTWVFSSFRLPCRNSWMNQPMLHAMDPLCKMLHSRAATRGKGYHLFLPFCLNQFSRQPAPLLRSLHFRVQNDPISSLPGYSVSATCGIGTWWPGRTRTRPLSPFFSLYFATMRDAHAPARKLDNE